MIIKGCGKAFKSATFHVRNDKPYCETHYKHPFGNHNVKTCHHCHEPIDGRASSAFGKDYHPHHFQCARCGKVLSVRVPGKKNQPLQTYKYGFA